MQKDGRQESEKLIDVYLCAVLNVYGLERYLSEVVSLILPPTSTWNPPVKPRVEVHFKNPHLRLDADPAVPTVLKIHRGSYHRTWL